MVQTDHALSQLHSTRAPTDSVCEAQTNYKTERVFLEGWGNNVRELL